MGHVQGHAQSKVEIESEIRPLTLTPGRFLTHHTASPNGHPADVKVY